MTASIRFQNALFPAILDVPLNASIRVNECNGLISTVRSELLCPGKIP